MKIDLTGKKALVTGSSKGIGLAIATGLAEAGAEVVVTGRSDAAINQALEHIRTVVPGANLSGVVADLGSAEGCASLVSAVPEADILINNAGIYGPQDFFETSDETWDTYYEVNVMSGVRLSRAYLPGMERKGWGRVIFISSESALNIPADMIHYGFSKTANLSIARGLAKRMAGTGVTVNAVLPGPTKSDGASGMLMAAAEGTGKSLDEVGREFVMSARPSSIIQRMAEVEEVANMVVYVASPLSSATTGAALRVEGGVVDSIG